MPSRPNKNKKLKHNFFHHSLPTIQIKLPKRFAEANSDVKFCCEEKEQDLSSCEAASLTCHQDHQMADSSSNGNGKLEETEKVEEGEAVKDVAIDDYSLEDVKASHEEPAEVVESVVVEEEKEEEKEEEGVAIAVEEKEASVVEEEEVKEEKAEQEQYVTYADETEEASPVVEDEVLEEVEEMIKTELVSNGVEETSALPDLSEEIKGLATNGVEETEVPCAEEKEKETEKEEEVVTVVEDVVSKEVEEVALPVEEVALPIVEEISIGETSAAEYKAETESAIDEPVSVPVPVSAPVESADAAEGYGERELPAIEEKPSIVSVMRVPLQPTSWMSCCGLFEALRRSDR